MTRWAGTGLPCSNEKTERDDDSKKSHQALDPRARQHDVGADREPEGVVADNRYFDEHANDRSDDQYERDHKPKVHCAYLLALRRNAQKLAYLIAIVTCEILVASSTATSEIRSLTRNTHTL